MVIDCVHRIRNLISNIRVNACLRVHFPHSLFRSHEKLCQLHSVRYLRWNMILRAHCRHTGQIEEGNEVTGIIKGTTQLSQVQSFFQKSQQNWCGFYSRFFLFKNEKQNSDVHRMRFHVY